jgi:hypothetical protein
MAMIYHQLGLLADERGRLDEAEDWCRQAITIENDVGGSSGLNFRAGANFEAWSVRPRLGATRRPRSSGAACRLPR